jgi:hypothetical protein
MMSALVRGTRFDLVHGSDFRDPLAAAFLAARQACLQLVLGVLRLAAGLLAQRLGARHDPLPVAGEHDHITRLAGISPPAGVEALEVPRA